jgi:hypothetical protein
MNIILVVTIVSNVNRYKSLQDSIVLLQSQVSSVKRKQDVMASDFRPDEQVYIQKLEKITMNMVGHKHDLNLTPYSDIYGLIKFIRYISGE